MRWVLAVLLTIHGLIHFMGTAKAFGLADLPLLTQPISRASGMAWLAAGVLMLGAAASLPLWPRWWWLLGAAALVASQAVVLTSWSDAKLGTIANLLLLAVVAYAFAAEGPLGLRAEYREAIRARQSASSTPATAPITEADLARLPEAVRSYLRTTGAVGRPPPRSFRATWRGRIRGTAEDDWMEFTAVQHNFVDEPSRFFLMDARRGGLPVDVLHAYTPSDASMRVRLLSMIPLVNASGDEPLRTETVTVFNDLCLLAPGALLDSRIEWETLDRHRVRARYTVGSNTIGATLVFDDAGALVDFVSDDRSIASADGRTFTRQRWSTPVSGYRDSDHGRVITGGVGRWHPPEGGYAYIELKLLDVELDPAG